MKGGMGKNKQKGDPAKSHKKKYGGGGIVKKKYPKKK
jgi:hypothetical protein